MVDSGTALESPTCDDVQATQVTSCTGLTIHAPVLKGMKYIFMKCGCWLGGRTVAFAAMAGLIVGNKRQYSNTSQSLLSNIVSVVRLLSLYESCNILNRPFFVLGSAVFSLHHSVAIALPSQLISWVVEEELASAKAPPNTVGSNIKQKGVRVSCQNH